MNVVVFCFALLSVDYLHLPVQSQLVDEKNESRLFDLLGKDSPTGDDKGVALPVSIEQGNEIGDKTSSDSHSFLRSATTSERDSSTVNMLKSLVSDIVNEVTVLTSTDPANQYVCSNSGDCNNKVDCSSYGCYCQNGICNTNNCFVSTASCLNARDDLAKSSLTCNTRQENCEDSSCDGVWCNFGNIDSSGNHVSDTDRELLIKKVQVMTKCSEGWLGWGKCDFSVEIKSVTWPDLVKENLGYTLAVKKDTNNPVWNTNYSLNHGSYSWTGDRVPVLELNIIEWDTDRNRKSATKTVMVNLDGASMRTDWKKAYEVIVDFQY